MTLQDGSTWYKASTVQEIFEIFGMITDNYILVCGNTAQGRVHLLECCFISYYVCLQTTVVRYLYVC